MGSIKKKNDFFLIKLYVGSCIKPAVKKNSVAGHWGGIRVFENTGKDMACFYKEAGQSPGWGIR
jgi:hypothetical protein